MTEEEAKKIAAANGYTSVPTKMKISVGTNAPTTGTVYFDAVRWQSRSVTTKIGYDTQGNYVTTETDPKGFTTSYESDTRGNMKRINLPKAGSYVLFGYDALDRVTYAENATYLGTVLSYDANGNVTQIDYQDNNTNTVIGSILQSYNELDQLTQVKDQNGNAITFKYDPNGNPTDVYQSNGTAIHYGYDNLDQVNSLSYTGDSTTWSFGYYENGELKNIVKNGTEATDIELDPDLNQITKVTFPAVNAVRNSVSYTYQPGGLVTSIANSPVGTSLYDYDQVGQLAKITGPNKQEAYYMYDEAGRVKKSYTWDGSKGYVTYLDYNERGLLSRYQLESESGSVILNDTFSYDENGNRTQIVHKSGSKEVYTYDLSNQLLTEERVAADGIVTSKISYSYDVMGNRKSKTAGTTTTSYAYDKANQLISIDGVSLTHDPNGNMTFDGNYKYVYNAENQLVKVTNSAGTVIAMYEYNHAGQRTKKDSGGRTEMYYYNGSILGVHHRRNQQIAIQLHPQCIGSVADDDRSYRHVPGELLL